MKPFLSVLLWLTALTLTAADEASYSVISLETTGAKLLSTYAPDNAWALVPTGRTNYGGVPFDVSRKLQLHGNQAAKDNRFYPQRIIGIPVGLRLSRLHVLHGTDLSETNTRPIAAVQLNFQGGSNFTFLITYGLHVRNWSKDPKNSDVVKDPDSTIAWTGDASGTDKDGKILRLYKSAFTLPNPAPIVENIDLYSLFGTSSELILGLTGEAPGPNERASAPASADLAPYRETIAVKVLDTKGRPLRDASVRGTAVRAGRPSRVFTNATTGSVIGTGGNSTTFTLGRMNDAAGEAGLVLVDFPAGARSLRLTAHVDNFVPAEINLQTNAVGKFPAAAEVRLATAVSIGGKVLDPEGQPLAKAKVEIFNAPAARIPFGTRLDELTTDAQGRWESRQVPDSLDISLRLTHKSFHRVDIDLDDPDNQDVTHAALLDKQARLRIQRIIDVNGSVRDENGEPLANVNVSLVRPHAGGYGSTSTRTDRRGIFHFKDVEHQALVLVAQGTANYPLPNHAPTSLPFHPETDEGPYKLVLKPGKPLRVQFVERVGPDSTEVRPAAITYLSVTAGGNRYISWNGKPDANGRFEWPQAPEGELRITAGTARRQFNLVARAGQAENRFDLSEKFTWPAVARDMETKEAITDFTVTPGRKELAENSLSRWPQDPKNGAVNGEAVIQDNGFANALKVESPGYEPQIFPMPSRSEPGTNVFLLKRAVAVRGVVLQPDGKPAIGAQVARPGHYDLRLGAGKLTRWNSSVAPIISAQANDAGEFELLPQVEQRLCIVHPSGYAETTWSNFLSHPTLKLEPYGIVEGVLFEGRAPATNAMVKLQPEPGGQGWPDYGDHFTTRTDEAGRFLFTHVPTGLRWLERIVQTTPTRTESSHGVIVEVGPGETVRTNLGGTGQTIIARLTNVKGAPVDWTRSWITFQTLLKTPRFLTEEEQSAWQASPAGRAHRAVQYRFAMSAETNGTLRAVDLPPGNYQLQAHLYGPADRPGTYGRYLGQFEQAVKVDSSPLEHNDTPLDLGRLVFPKPQ